MGGEPWCFTPDQIARLTDYQILHLYILPAVRRSREAELRGKGMDPELAAGVAGSEPSIPPREAMVHALMAMGMSRSAAESEYDRQLAETLKLWEEENAHTGNRGGTGVHW